MNAPSKDIADYLVSLSYLGFAIKSNLFIGNEPATDSNCVTIFDISGFQPEIGYNYNHERYYYHMLQIRVRHTHYNKGWKMINKVRNALHNKGHLIINGTNYEVIKVIQEPALLDYDANDKVRFVMTIELQRR